MYALSHNCTILFFTRVTKTLPKGLLLIRYYCPLLLSALTHSCTILFFAGVTKTLPKGLLLIGYYVGTYKPMIYLICCRCGILGNDLPIILPNYRCGIFFGRYNFPRLNPWRFDTISNDLVPSLAKNYQLWHRIAQTFF